MNESVIKVEGLSKKYLIGHQTTGGYTSLRDVISSNLRGVVQKTNALAKKTKVKFEVEEFWALRDIDFSVESGERVGIIGRNGAGKSTLLKTLSRITEPTAGRITLRGKVASLLEVGTGFHPELSGRENIYLNGAILGMSRAQIREKFDEIVEFAEVEKFLDTPVKRYSSGMYVRLAFAVAAHLEPEILIVDEVLAVGDAQFQNKCLGKMEDVSRNQGRTVLFVSHNMGVISQLCERTIVLHKGTCVFNGKTSEAIDFYLTGSSGHLYNEGIRKDVTTDTNQFVNIYNCDAANGPKNEFRVDEPIGLYLELFVPRWNPALELAVSVYDKYKRRVFTIHEPLQRFYSRKPEIKFHISIPPEFLTPGKYSWLICINHPGNENFDLQDDVCGFSIIDTGTEFAQYDGLHYGCVFANYQIHALS